MWHPPATTGGKSRLFGASDKAPYRTRPPGHGVCIAMVTGFSVGTRRARSPTLDPLNIIEDYVPFPPAGPVARDATPPSACPSAPSRGLPIGRGLRPRSFFMPGLRRCARALLEAGPVLVPPKPRRGMTGGG